MSKMIAVIDEPMRCGDCALSRATVGYKIKCVITGEVMSPWHLKTRPDRCPLRKMPEKKDICGTYDSDYYKNGGEMPSSKLGWNKCVDYIVGE